MTTKKVYHFSRLRFYTLVLISIMVGGLWLLASKSHFLCIPVLVVTTLYGISCYALRLQRVEVQQSILSLYHHRKCRQSMVIQQIISCPWLIFILGKGVYHNNQQWVLITRMCLNQNDFIALCSQIKAILSRV